MIFKNRRWLTISLLWLGPLAFLLIFYFYPLGSILKISLERSQQGLFSPFLECHLIPHHLAGFELYILASSSLYHSYPCTWSTWSIFIRPLSFPREISITGLDKYTLFNAYIGCGNSIQCFSWSERMAEHWLDQFFPFEQSSNPFQQHTNSHPCGACLL